MRPGRAAAAQPAPAPRRNRRKDPNMKLQQGDKFPELTLNLLGGGTLCLPDQMPTRYLALLFYRGIW